MKTKKDMFKEGCIGEAYGRETFLKVVPAPSIDKVKFTIVKMETQGKDHVDFYLDIDEMRKFADDVASGVAGKKFAEDMKEQYPKAYQFTTGENGCKHLNIGGGQKGIRFNIKTPDGAKQAIVPWEVLKTICFDFKMVVGLVPVVQGTYYHSLIAAFYNGEKERANSFRDYNAKQDGTCNAEPAPSQQTNNGVTANAQAQSSNAQKAPQQPKPANPAPSPASTKNAAPAQTVQQQPKTPDPVSITVKVKQPITDLAKGGKAFQVWNEQNQTLNVIIPKDRLEKGGLERILDEASKCGSKMVIRGWIKDDRILIA